jgi:hypothetical protein
MTTEGSCHCGAIRFEVETPPATVTECNCSVCRRTGVLWAYYSPGQVRFVAGDNATDVYIWGDRSLRLHRCKVCGLITHWAPLDKTLDRMGVNARLMDPAVLAAARVRKIDGADTWKYLGEE